MFWRVQGEEQTSPVEKILDRDDFTLEDLLLEEDCIQEVKAMNDRLIDYLKQPETVAQLMVYVVEPSKAVVKLERQLRLKQLRELEEEEEASKDGEGNDGGADGEGEGDASGLGEELDKLSLGKGGEEAGSGASEAEAEGSAPSDAKEAPQIEPMRPEELQRYAMQSAQRVCEIFCCEVDEIFTSLVGGSGDDETEGGDDFLGYLFSFLDQPAPLDSVLSGYYSRVMVSAVQRRPAEVSEYIQAHPEILSKLVGHLYSHSIADLVLRLISGDEQNALYQKEQGNEWLVDTKLLEFLVDRVTDVSPQEGRPEQERRLHLNAVSNAVACVVGVANTAPSAIATQLQEEQYVRRLMQVVASSSPAHVLIAVVDVLVAMLQPRPTKQSLSPDVIISYSTLSPSMAMEETIDEGMVECAGHIMEKVGELCGMLEPTEQEQSFEASYGKVPSRLGMRRWKILDLISKVVNIAEVDKCVRVVEETDLVPLCFSLMIKMPFNSILHNAVQGIIFGLLVSESREVMSVLIDKCKIHHLVSSAPQEIDSTTMELSKENKPLRAGYLGIVTSIANQILSFAATDTEIEKKLEDDLQWTTWVVDVLVAQNKLEDPTSWECGRPSRVNDILGDMGSSSTVDLSLYSGLSVGVSSNDNDRYGDGDGDDYDLDGMDDDDDDDDVYETEAFQSLEGADAGGGGDDEGYQTVEDNVVLISATDDLASGSQDEGQEVDLKLIQEKQQLKRADTPYGTAGAIGNNPSSSDAQFNSANFWRSSYLSYDIEDETES